MDPFVAGFARREGSENVVYALGSYANRVPCLRLAALSRTRRSLLLPLCALALVVTLPGCLMHNEMFRPDGQAKETPTGKHDIPTGQEPGSSLGKSTRPDHSSGPDTVTSTSGDPNGDVSTSFTTPSNIPTGSTAGLTTESSPTTSTSSSSSDSDTASSTSKPSPGSRWIPITVRNVSSNRVAQLGTSASVVVDHPRLIALGARADGQDLHIYSMRNGTAKALDRLLDPQSKWQLNNTKLWFRTDGDLAAQESATNVYYLVLDDSSGAPKQDPKGVFLLYDEFVDGPEALSQWSITSLLAVNGSGSAKVKNGELELQASASSGVEERVARSASLPVVPGIAVEAMLSFNHHTDSTSCNVETLISLWSAGSTQVRAAWQRRGERWDFINQRAAGGLYSQNFSSRPVNGDKRRHLARWSRSSVAMYTDGAFAANMTPQNTGFTTPADGSLSIGFKVRADGDVCTRTSVLWVDWVLARQVSDFEIEATPRYEELHTEAP